MASAVALAGCQDGEPGGGEESLTRSSATDFATTATGTPAAAPPPRDYLVLEIEGNVTREPPYPPAPKANCGRTGHPFSRVDVENRSLYLVKPGGSPLGGHDFDRSATWIVVWDRLMPDQNACGSRPALWAAEQNAFRWALSVNGGEFNVSIERSAGGITLDGDASLAADAQVVLHREFTADEGRTWSDMTFRLRGGWSTADVHDIESELDLPSVGAGASWHKELPS